MALTSIPSSPALGRLGGRVVEAPSSFLPLRLRDVWEFRELLYFLVWRDIKVRYAQTALGAVWMVFQPLALMLVYTFAFSHLARVTIPLHIPYPIFALGGLTLWVFVSRGVFVGAESLVSNMTLVTKTACPRIIIPLASVIAVFVDFAVALVLFLVIDGMYGRAPGWRFVFAFPLLFLAFLLTLGISLLLSVVEVRYRDVGQALPFVIQLWFFTSPIAYLLRTPGKSWETLVQALNPLVGIVLAFRWALLGTPLPRGILVVAILVTMLIFAAGLIHFARQQHTIADDV